MLKYKDKPGLVGFVRRYEAASWCPGPESNRHAQGARDFKSLVSTNFTTRAVGFGLAAWERPAFSQ